MAPTSSRPLFLGLDLSTQQLKAVLLDEDSQVIHEAAVHFDRDLPHHGTTSGAISGPDEGEVTSPVKMWLEAIDLLCQRLKDNRIDFSAIAAISGAGQVPLSLSLVLPPSYLMCTTATWISLLVQRCDSPSFRIESKSKPD